jgi:hypothetical protein
MHQDEVNGFFEEQTEEVRSNRCEIILYEIRIAATTLRLRRARCYVSLRRSKPACVYSTTRIGSIRSVTSNCERRGRPAIMGVVTLVVRRQAS